MHHERISSQKRLGITRLVNGSHGFTCQPRVYRFIHEWNKSYSPLLSQPKLVPFTDSERIQGWVGLGPTTVSKRNRYTIRGYRIYKYLKQFRIVVIKTYIALVFAEKVSTHLHSGCYTALCIFEDAAILGAVCRDARDIGPALNLQRDGSSELPATYVIQNWVIR